MKFKDIIKNDFIGKPNTGKSTLINYILGEKTYNKSKV